jgi:hypothetical protein
LHFYLLVDSFFDRFENNTSIDTDSISSEKTSFFHFSFFLKTIFSPSWFPLYLFFSKILIVDTSNNTISPENNIIFSFHFFIFSFHFFIFSFFSQNKTIFSPSWFLLYLFFSILFFIIWLCLLSYKYLKKHPNIKSKGLKYIC